MSNDNRTTYDIALELVVCPFCGARPEQVCTTVNPSTRVSPPYKSGQPTYMHQTRVEAVNEAFGLGYVNGENSPKEVPAVSSERIEQLAEIIVEMTGEPRAGRFERTMVRAALQGAGFMVEGGE